MVKSGGQNPSQTAPTEAQTTAPVRPQFCGTYHHSVDPKGRVAVPAALRRGLPEGSVVAQGPDSRLVLYPPQAWAAEQERFTRTAETPSQARHFRRLLLGAAYPFEVDAQGRLLLTASQRTWAHIDDSAVFVGLGDGVELCGDVVWRSDANDLNQDEFTRLHDLVHRSDDQPVSLS